MENEDLKEIKTQAKMNDLKLQALLNLLAKEGVISKNEFEQELQNLLEEKN
ncbi:hypothetical protein ACFL3V_04295 [Nanoarchaeota archaeon]